MDFYLDEDLMKGGGGVAECEARQRCLLVEFMNGNM
jgi:hypothetical protein